MRYQAPLLRLTGALFLLAGSLPAHGEDAETLGEAVTHGTFGAQLRWRLEHVKQDPLPKDGTAVPLRIRVNYGTADWRGFSLFGEYDYVHDFGRNDYNEGGGNTPERIDYPVIADPAGADLNQAYLQYRSTSGSRLRAGRQRIIYDNARFIGNVGWRQNEQTFDAVHFEREGLHGWDLRGGYVDRANRIFGRDVPAGKHDMETWLVNVSHALGEGGKLTAYFYDIDNDDAPGLSNRSYGVRFNGKREALGYGIEFAYQQDSGNAPVDYSAPYWRLDLSWAFDAATLFGGYELLGGDRNEAGKAFRTPLATLHAFNGWADKFLNTPDDGLADFFVGLKGKAGAWSWTAVYHDFSADDGPADFGTEVDASVSRRFGDSFALLFKSAWFDTSSPSYGDTRKYWVMLTADF